MCGDCARCHKDIKLILVYGDRELKFEFNFASKLEEEKIGFESFFVSSRVEQWLVSKYDLAFNQVHFHGDSAFFLVSSSSSFENLSLGNAVLERKESDNSSLYFDSVELFKQFIRASTGNEHSSFSKTAQTQTEQIDCSSAEIVHFTLTRDDFKYILDSTFPEKLTLFLVKSNKCSATDSKIVSKVIASSKSIGVIFFSSVFENILFSFLNQIDILGIIFYVSTRKDEFVTEIISLISGLKCLSAYKYTSFESRFLSNRKILHFLMDSEEQHFSNSANSRHMI